MNLEWLDSFSDPYLQGPLGQGVLLSGVVLGMMAKQQAGQASVDTAPIFKQIMFGKMQRRDLLRHLSRIPELLRAYEMPEKTKAGLTKLTALVGDMLLQGDGEMGVDGNFVFSVAFLNANDYYWRIYEKQNNVE